MKIIGLNGSPRKNGNTASLLQSLLEGAAKEGAETKVLNLNEMNIRGCQGCNGCKKKGHCVIQDDMQTIYQAINDGDIGDILVFASPIYMWQMTSQLKAVLDRLYAYVTIDYKSILPKPIKVVLIFTQHRSDRESFMNYFNSVAGILRVIGFVPIPEIIVGIGLKELSDVKNNEELMRSAYNFGRRLVQTN